MKNDLILLGETNSEGYKSKVYQDPITRSVFFTGDADINADGANGQHGKNAAYMKWDRGSEFAANGGMKVSPNGSLVGNSTWYPSIVICDAQGKPYEFDSGIYGSKTAYKYPNFDLQNPAAYLDSETIPVITIPPWIVQRTGKDDIIMGCSVICINKNNSKQSLAMVGDIGPKTKVGEISIDLARRLNINSSPRYGGEDRPVIDYFIFPSRHVMVDSVILPLITSKGKYIYHTEGLKYDKL